MAKSRCYERVYHLAKLIPRDFKCSIILDFGCGDGTITNNLKNILSEKYNISVDIVYGLDIIPADIINFVPSFDQVENDSVELVTCFMTLHHLEDLSGGLSDIKRILKDDGLLFIREHDVSPKNDQLKEFLVNKHLKYNDVYQNYYSKDELISRLESFGFEHLADSIYTPGTSNPQHIYHSMFKLHK